MSTLTTSWPGPTVSPRSEWPKLHLHSGRLGFAIASVRGLVIGQLLLLHLAFGAELPQTAAPLRAGSRPEPVTFEQRSIELIRGPAPVTGVAVSPDGTLLAVSSGFGRDMGELAVWNLADRTKRYELRRPYGIRSLAFAPDGKLIATGDFDRIARLYEAASGELVAELAGHTIGVNSVAFSPDGRRLITGGLEGTVRIWDVNSHKLLRTLSGHVQDVFSVAISPDGRTIASGGRDQAVRLWDVEAGQERQRLAGHASGIEYVAFSPDGVTLASAGWDGAVKIWDVSSGEQRRTWSDPDGLRMYCVAFAPDGKTVAAGTSNGLVRIWDFATGELRATLEAAGPDGEKRSDAVFSIGFTPDGKLLAVGHTDAATTLWEVAAARQVAVLRTEPDPDDQPSTVLAVAYSPDGRRLVSLHADRTVRIREGQKGKLQGILKGQDDEIACMALSPDGALLATGGSGKDIILWAIDASGSESPAGASENATFRVSPRGTLAGHTSSVFSLAFSRDGRWLASGGFDHAVRLWSIPDGAAKATLAGHSGAV